MKLFTSIPLIQIYSMSIEMESYSWKQSFHDLSERRQEESSIHILPDSYIQKSHLYNYWLPAVHKHVSTAQTEKAEVQTKETAKHTARH